MIRQPGLVLMVGGLVTFGGGAGLLAASMGSAATAGADRPRLSVTEAYVPAPGSAAEVMAFATVRNAGGAPDDLITVRADVSTIVMMHRGGGDSMEMVDGLALPAHHTVTLTGSGLHIMIMQPTRLLRPGDLVRLTFVFARSAPLSVSALVTAANAGPPPPGGHAGHAGQGGHGHG
jgi:copper(I)-binding protein